MIVDERIGGIFSYGPHYHDITCGRHDEHNAQQQPQKTSNTESLNCGYNTKQQQRHQRTNNILPFGHRYINMAVHSARKKAETEVSETIMSEDEPSDAVYQLVYSNTKHHKQNKPE